MCHGKLVTVLLLGVVLLFVGGCAEPPLEQQQSAQAAVTAAKDANAETYAAAAWLEAQEAIKSAEAELMAQEKKLGVLRSYGPAQELLAKAQEAAERAGQEALAAKEQARREAEAKLDAARNNLQLTQELLATMPQGKDTRAEIESMQQELLGLQNALGEAAAVIATEDFARAGAQLGEIESKVAAIKADLENALAKVGTRR